MPQNHISEKSLLGGWGRPARSYRCQCQARDERIDL